MKRIRLNCGHGRLIDPTSEEAYDLIRTYTVQCLTCPTYLGEFRVEAVEQDQVLKVQHARAAARA